MRNPDERELLSWVRIVAIAASFVCRAASGQVAPGQVANGAKNAKPQAPGAVAPSQAGPASQGIPPKPDPPPVEFESHGLQYEAVTKNGITVMFAAIPPHVKDFNIVQVTVTNGSLVTWTVKPSDFTFVRPDGTTLQTMTADEVVSSLLEKAGRNDVIKLQLLYEASIYALSNFRSTNGYEQRREAAMAQFVNPRFKAAAAASAITLVPVKLRSGDSTDGAVFFENRTKEKSLGAGRLMARTCGESFAFQVFPEIKLHQ
jgi:hypothetical protein